MRRAQCRSEDLQTVGGPWAPLGFPLELGGRRSETVSLLNHTYTGEEDPGPCGHFTTRISYGSPLM